MRTVTKFLLLALWLGLAGAARAGTATNALVWEPGADRVSADIRGEALWPLLEDIAHQTGWHIFVEPGANRKTDVKFAGLPSGEALKKLLGDLNFAYVPKTNEADQLYVFTTSLRNATQRVQAGTTNKPVARKHAPNELLIKVKPGTDIEALAKSLGAKVIGRDDKQGIYRLQFADAAATETALGELKSNPDVTAVEYNNYLDPPTLAQKLEGTTGPGPVALTLDTAASNDPCHPVVGLIDTPMQSLGSQLDPFILKPISVTGDTVVPGTAAGPTHATSMAQTILRAVSQQSSSSAVKILPVDVYGNSETATTWNVALGVKAAVDGGATVLNMSLGGTSDSTILSGILQQAMAKGVVVFAAAGNQPVATDTFPAALPGVIAVAATQGQQLAPYSNFGSFISLALPGASVVYLGNQAYVVNGTSPATAYASGIAAGYKGINCDSWAQIQQMMQQKFPVPKN